MHPGGPFHAPGRTSHDVTPHPPHWSHGMTPRDMACRIRWHVLTSGDVRVNARGVVPHRTPSTTHHEPPTHHRAHGSRAHGGHPR